MARRFLAVRLPASQVQPGTAALQPYLPHGAPIPRIIDAEAGGTDKLVLLHPRIQDPAALPAELRTELSERLGGRFTEHEVEVAEPAWRALFVVQFASRSKDGPAPGPDLPSRWRKVLSNFSTETPHIIGGRTYASVEHYFQGRKAGCSNKPQMADWFTMEHDGPHRVDDDPRAAKRAGGRKGYQQHGATLDTTRWLDVRDEVMQTALDARLAQDELFTRILRSTRGLVLLHFERSGARSYWGGSLDRQTGLIKGENRLGAMMMERREQPLTRPSDR